MFQSDRDLSSAPALWRCCYCVGCGVCLGLSRPLLSRLHTFQYFIYIKPMIKPYFKVLLWYDDDP